MIEAPPDPLIVAVPAPADTVTPPGNTIWPFTTLTLSGGVPVGWPLLSIVIFAVPPPLVGMETVAVFAPEPVPALTVMPPGSLTVPFRVPAPPAVTVPIPGIGNTHPPGARLYLTRVVGKA